MTAAFGKALAVGAPRCDYGGVYLNAGRAYILDYTYTAGTHGWYQAATFSGSQAQVRLVGWGAALYPAQM